MRPATLEDLQITHDLWLAYDLLYSGREEVSLEELRSSWSAPGLDLERDTRLVLNQEGELVACFQLEHRQFVQFYVDLCIRPGYNDPQLADTLFALGEARARELMAEAEPGVRVSLISWASSANHEALQHFARFGLVEHRRSWRMEIDMAMPPEAPVWPAGVVLRPFVRGRDDRAVFEANDAAFQDHWGHLPGNFVRWKHHHLELASFDPSLWFIAMEGEQIAGLALCARHGTEGWVDVLGVLRPWRSRGLGMALLRQAFGAFYRQDARKVGLGVDAQSLTGATRLYKRAGMYVAQENISCEKELRAGVDVSTQTLSK